MSQRLASLRSNFRLLLAAGFAIGVVSPPLGSSLPGHRLGVERRDGLGGQLGDLRLRLADLGGDLGVDHFGALGGGAIGHVAAPLGGGLGGRLGGVRITARKPGNVKLGKGRSALVLKASKGNHSDICIGGKIN